jgi:hypothetical protein
MTAPEDLAWLRAALQRHGLALRPEDEGATLATARFLAAAARLIRQGT